MNKNFLWIGYFFLFATSAARAEVVQISAGDGQSIALITGGDTFQWGRLGGPLPVSVFGLSRVTALASGRHHALALATDGSVWAWGENNFGQLGNGTAITSDRPQRVMDITGALAIAAAANQSFALKNDGTVWAWGANQKGQLGDGTTIDRRGPVIVEGLIDITAIAAGESILVALRKDGRICIAGKSTEPDCDSPFSSVVAIAAGGASAYVLLRDGTVHTVHGGACGRALEDNEIIMYDIRTIAAGVAHLMLLREDGTLWACGSNSFGQLGDSSTESQKRPVPVASGLTGVTKIAAGHTHSLAVTDSGIWAWGDNSAGQLGTGNTTTQLLPLPIWDGTGRLR